jgi:hypothetical protein
LVGEGTIWGGTKSGTVVQPVAANGPPRLGLTSQVVMVVRDDDVERHGHDQVQDLYDCVIQQLFGVGLGLRSTLPSMPDPKVRALLRELVTALDGVIGEVRSALYSALEQRPAPNRGDAAPDPSVLPGSTRGDGDSASPRGPGHGTSRRIHRSVGRDHCADRPLSTGPLAVAGKPPSSAA